MRTLDNILYLLKQQKKTQKELTDFLKVSKSTFTDWKSGRISSYVKYLPQIAEFFDVSVDYLLGNSDIKKAPSNIEDAIDIKDKKAQQALELFNKLSDEQKKAATDYLSFLLSKDKE